eukprot:Clim_evm29s227 gene=Clim_evmTU29s227
MGDIDHGMVPGTVPTLLKLDETDGLHVPDGSIEQLECDVDIEHRLSIKPTDTRATTAFKALPEEIMEKIIYFCFHDRTCKDNRPMTGVAYSAAAETGPQSRRKITITRPEHVAQLLQLAGISRRWRSLIFIMLDGINLRRTEGRMGPEMLQSILTAMGRKPWKECLRSVTLAHCHAVDDYAVMLVARLSELREVDLSGSYALTDEACTYLTRLKKLQSLGLSCCRHLTDRSLDIIAKGCGQSLRRIDVSRCMGLTPEGMISFAKQCPDLESVDVGNVSGIDAETLPALAQALGPKLQSLVLAGNRRINGHALATMASLCPQLESLDVTGCGMLTDMGIVSLVQSCPGLRSLNLSLLGRVSDGGCEAIALHCRNLEELNIRGCGGITINGFRALVHSTHLGHTLRRVVIQGGDCLSDELLAALAENWHLLESLRIEDCTRISDAGLASLYPVLSRGLLTQIVLDSGLGITDAGICAMLGGRNTDSMSLSSSPPSHSVSSTLTRTHSEVSATDSEDNLRFKLTRLSLTAMPNLSDRSVRFIGERCPDLQVLALSSCCGVSDASGEYIASLGRLRVLSLRACTRIIGSFGYLLLRSCRFLEYLDVSHCPFLTSELTISAAQLPRLRALEMVGCGDVDAAVVHRCAAKGIEVNTGRYVWVPLPGWSM